MLIGELAKRSNFSRDTIRYYEKLELLQKKQVLTLANGYKDYSDDALKRLLDIQHLKATGFTLKEIKKLFLHQKPESYCKDLPTLLEHKIQSLDKKIQTLLAFKTSLLNTQEQCSPACRINNGMPECLNNGADSYKSSPKTNVSFYSPN